MTPPEEALIERQSEDALTQLTDLENYPRTKAKEALEDELKPHGFKNIEYDSEGAQGFGYTADWRNQKVFIKVGRTPVGPTADLAEQRGYTSENEVDVVTSFDYDAEANHLSTIYWAGDLSERGYKGTYFISKFFPGQNLEEFVQDNDLSKEQYGQLFSQMLKGVRTYVETDGILHRDLKPSNVMALVKEDGSIDSRIIDFQNAGRIEDMQPQPRPTMGSREVADPVIYPEFSGLDESAYGISSEIYQIAATMLFAATGEHAVYYDIFEGSGNDVNSGESLLGPEGKINITSHNEAIRNGTKKLPKNLKKLGAVIEKGMNADPTVRYTSLDEFRNDVQKVFTPSIWDRIKGKGKTIVTASVLATILAASWGEHQVNRTEAELETIITQAEKIHVVPKFNGGDVTVENTVVELENILAYDMNDYLGGNILETKDDPYSFDKTPFIRAKPGDIIKFNVSLRETSADMSVLRGLSRPTFPGKMYIEGYEAERFWARAGPYDSTDLHGSMGGGYLPDGSVTITIPEDISDGTHIIPIEIYGPMNAQEGVLEHIEYTDSSEAMIRHKVRLIVGEPSEPIGVNYVKLELFGVDDISFVGATNSYTEYLDNKMYIAYLDDGTKISDDKFSRLFHKINQGDQDQTGTLRISGYDDDGNLFQTFLPMASECYNDEWPVFLEARKQQEQRRNIVNMSGARYGYKSKDVVYTGDAVEKFSWSIAPPDSNFSNAIKEIVELDKLPEKLVASQVEPSNTGK